MTTTHTPQHVRSIEQGYWRYAELPQLELRSTRHSTQPYKAHSHRQLSIGAIEQGITRVNFVGGDQGREQTAVAGELVLIEPHQVHSCNPQAGRPRSYHMLYLDSDWCLQRLSALYASPVTQLHCDQFRICDPALFHRYMALIKALHGQQIDQAKQCLDRLMFAILSRYCTPHTAAADQHNITRQLKRRLLDNLVSPPSLETLAGELNCRQETLIRRFNREMGLPPKAFVSNARIEYAKILLKGGMAIVDVASATGFADQSHFHKTFVSYTAATPGQYQPTT